MIGPKQTPLERVREIGAALGVQINAQQPSQLQRAVRSLERPILPQGHSPGQERLAALFLKNAPEKNRADPRLAPAQTIVDTAMQLARNRGDSARSVTAQGEAARQRIANSIRIGETLDAGVSGRAQDNKPVPPAPDKGCSRWPGRAVSMLVGVPVLGRRVVARDIRVCERMTARFLDKRGDFTIGPASVAQLFDLVAYHVDEGGDREPFLA
ncbi:hypothetical protein [Sphingomonas sp. PP-CE-1G-424]|uniref:hypothetical protein n=1 Tax=Sphingomonas sp. PP-CE-1G-424 TaxID=2135658 RepID=UPI001FB2257E|nr:hypothetical protein [Sphingomonas sp. PP-CE-1G-424]